MTFLGRPFALPFPWASQHNLNPTCSNGTFCYYCYKIIKEDDKIMLQNCQNMLPWSSWLTINIKTSYPESRETSVVFVTLPNCQTHSHSSSSIYRIENWKLGTWKVSLDNFVNKEGGLVNYLRGCMSTFGSSISLDIAISTWPTNRKLIQKKPSKT